MTSPDFSLLMIGALLFSLPAFFVGGYHCGVKVEKMSAARKRKS